MIKSEDWDKSLEEGLLFSLCFIPLLSYGATAPLFATAEPQTITDGWSPEPLGLQRLRGAESDREDGVLKVLSSSPAHLAEH